ncbi:hypothetical protein E1B28_010380 [Marasmius oreades]|uniref:RRM domain-containing protein n=1 Tax=Marasmius oreades TaxID=181124 RepID=A0A9P7UR28_9AGAR|nr:uncharacterized protein E1B28_010380 [Marasmius oreades]KAG7091337.1 hypothetical protein E1B28_010380 [Marasmius oreades]
MDDQTAFAQQYPSAAAAYSTFDIDMMKRSMDTTGGPEAKKARWSPTSATANAGASSPSASSARDAFANYGYGPQASINQLQYNTPTSPLYSTPQTLSVNVGGGQGSPGQLSPGGAATQSGQAGAGASNGWGYNQAALMGMGMPSVNGMNGMNGMNLGMLGGFGYGGFNQQRLPTLQIPNSPSHPNGNQGAYSPVAFSPGLQTPLTSNPLGLSPLNPLSATLNPQNRTIYIGSLPSTASVDELLNLVHFGPIESIRVLPEKSCVFLSFLDAQTAAAFHADSTLRKLSLHGQELKVGWGKPSAVPQQVVVAVQQQGASRNVYLGGLNTNPNVENGGANGSSEWTEEGLRDELGRFGLIDQVKIVRDKGIGFVHFLSIGTAIKVVNTLPSEPTWAGKRVSFGKDRCAYIPKSQQAAAQQAQAAAAQSLVAQSNTPYSPFSPVDTAMLGMVGGMSGVPGIQGMNRTVYLGNIHPETTTEELCNAIRGGVLQSIRYMVDKHICFVTFIDPAAAFTFYQVSSFQGLTLNNRRLKIGWGKNSGPLPPALALAVHGGATRNVYIGNIEDFEAYNEERLKRDFVDWGEIELVNFLREKNCAFVNFTNISNAIKAIEAVKSKPEYANLRISYGKDRCANPPRSGPQGGGGGGGGRRQNNSNHAAVEEGVEIDGGVQDGVEGDMHVDGSGEIPVPTGAVAGAAA